VQTSGIVACWGENSYLQSSPPGGTFIQVSSGWYHTCGLKTDGTLACWGSNSDGQSTPPAGTYTGISAGHGHTCAVRTNGTVTCWGDNATGQSADPKPDLTVTKSHETGGVMAVGDKVTWTITISNVGSVAATFRPGQAILSDNLPDAGLEYEPPGVQGTHGVTCPAYITCDFPDRDDLSCRADRTTVTVHPGGHFDVAFRATPGEAGTFSNPRTAGLCRVDPDLVVEESDETNNDCSDSFAIIHLTVSPAAKDLQLNWTDVAADSYNVWTGTDDPFSIPGADCSASKYCTLVSRNTHVDSGASGDGNNHFYVVEAVSSTDGVFGTSNRAGVFLFAIAPGTSSTRRGGPLW
jgi:uncharacterized repeat protein (TIGR01451 family)